ncbi:MAG: acyclic terpene utilization AtuA family protein [Rhodospirillales bacterium]|nr:acyclic terpene utilization AtuA family protein [Rhodospirillales bacterium]
MSTADLESSRVLRQAETVPLMQVISATGVCGSGFSESSLAVGVARGADFIGCDAGSTDPGPAPLGSGTTAFPRRAVKRDLRLMLLAARQAKIPLLIGSAGTAGGEPHLAIFRDIVIEIAREEGLSFRLGLIHAEQDKATLKRRLAEGRITPLRPAPHFDDAVIDRAERIVGMMGAEPYLKALDEGAEVVLAGRSSDCAIFAGLPIRAGIDPGLAWHAAKLLECGAAVAVARSAPDSVLVGFGPDYFEVEPLNPAMRCSPQSVAAHALYENADPYRLVENSGTLDLSQSRYDTLDERRVRVRGSRFEPAARYTVKLEGAECVGYQSVVIGSIRDPYIIRQLDEWLARLRQHIDRRLADVFGAGSQDSIHIRVYGKNGTMGQLEPVQTIAGHEVCLVIEATAATQEDASAIAAIARHQALHLPIPEWSGLITALACPYSPAHLERGPIYRFCVNHVLAPDDPYEMFPIEHLTVGGGRRQ